MHREWRCGDWSADGHGRLQQAPEPERGGPFWNYILMLSVGCRKLLWLPYGGCTKQWQHVLLVLPSGGESRNCPCGDLASGWPWWLFHVRGPQAPWTCYHHREFYPSEKQMFLNYFYFLCRWTRTTNWVGLRRTLTLGAESTTCSTLTTLLELVRTQCTLSVSSSHPGFSFSDKMPETQMEVTNNLYEFLQQWYTLFPMYQASEAKLFCCLYQFLLRATPSIPLESPMPANSFPRWPVTFTRGTRRTTTRSSEQILQSQL